MRGIMVWGRERVLLGEKNCIWCDGISGLVGYGMECASFSSGGWIWDERVVSVVKERGKGEKRGGEGER